LDHGAILIRVIK